MDCMFCGMPYMEWRMDEITSKSKLWDTNLGLWHDCKKSPEAKKKNKDREWKKQREKILKEERIKKVMKLKAMLFCNYCNKGVKATDPCQHLLKDGFEVGVDGADFYSDSFQAIERRKFLKKQKEKPKIRNKPKGLDGFI